MYKRLDDKYIKPCLLRENHFKDPKIIETYENLAERDALEFVKRNPTQFAELAGAKTMQELGALKGSGDSATNLDNVDPKEYHYNQTEQDLDERGIHHVLSENLFMPRNRVREALLNSIEKTWLQLVNVCSPGNCPTVVMPSRMMTWPWVTASTTRCICRFGG